MGYAPRGPFLERPSKLTGPVSSFDSEVSRKVGCVLTSNEVHFVSLAENFTVQFSKVLSLPSGTENKNTLTGPVMTGSFEKRAPDLLRGISPLAPYLLLDCHSEIRS